MIFKDLYEYAENVDAPIVRVKDLARRIVAHHQEVGEITFTPVVLDENTTLGYVVYDYDRSSAYDHEYSILGVRYSDRLNSCHRRYVCCKETMHSFDTPEEQANSRDKFFTLMRELEANPLAGNASAMLNSENQAEWMALLVLCPKTRRDTLKLQWEKHELTSRQVAEKLLVPEWTIRPLMGELYDQAYQELVGSYMF